MNRFRTAFLLLALAPAAAFAGNGSDQQAKRDIRELHERYKDFYDSDRPKAQCPKYPPITCTPPLDPLLAPCCPGMAPTGQ
ncbi:MAG: hypothetical protein U1E53_17310 [Dongiaceae bacterium]